MDIEKLDLQSPDGVQGNVEKIRELFPNVVTEGPDGLAVDFDALRQELSDTIVEGPQERYRLDWPGKRAAMLAANTPISKTLRPVREESVDFDTTQNLFIEGDNLDALKLLQDSYLGKVKMIYIDPPYNTGNDFIYKDNFTQGKNEYLEESGQVREDGGRLVANPESNGRYHSDWLSMMYPRLKLARNLMRDDGIIFVSIDDNELPGLQKLCDEIFGENNFIGNLIWSKKRKGSFLSKKLVSVTEYIVAYGKNSEIRLFGGKADASESQPLIKRTNNVSKLEFPAGTVTTKLSDGTISAGQYGKGSSSVKILDDIQIENGEISSVLKIEGPFIWSQEYLDKQIKNGAQLVVNTQNFQVRAFKAPDENSFKALSSLLDGVKIRATNEDGYEEIVATFGSPVMDYPKPINLIKYLLEAVGQWDDSFILMDFFAGSGPSAVAAMSYSTLSEKSVRTISVQLPEVSLPESEAHKQNLHTIAEISKERIRRAGAKILEDNTDQTGNLDIGFRVLKIDSSNMKDVHADPSELKQGELLDSVSHIKPDRSGEDLLFQVMLNQGIELSQSITRETVGGKAVYSVGEDNLAACFDDNISDELVKNIANRKPLYAIFRDESFKEPADKINAAQIFKQLTEGHTRMKVI